MESNSVEEFVEFLVQRNALPTAEKNKKQRSEIFGLPDGSSKNKSNLKVSPGKKSDLETTLIIPEQKISVSPDQAVLFLKSLQRAKIPLKSLQITYEVENIDWKKEKRKL